MASVTPCFKAQVWVRQSRLHHPHQEGHPLRGDPALMGSTTSLAGSLALLELSWPDRWRCWSCLGRIAGAVLVEHFPGLG